jgi:hypothetical protein
MEAHSAITARWWTAPPRERCHPLGHPPCLGQRTAQQDLNLRVDAAELVGRPAGQGVVDCGVDPEEDLPTFAHV